MPYTGDYRGTIWNSQALFATDIAKQHAKQDYAWRLLRTHDFAGFAETHGTHGNVTACTFPRGYQRFWSHGVQQQAGVGLTIQKFCSR